MPKKKEEKGEAVDLCGHVNPHSEELVITCELPKGHAGLHQAHYTRLDSLGNEVADVTGWKEPEMPQ